MVRARARARVRARAKVGAMVRVRVRVRVRVMVEGRGLGFAARCLVPSHGGLYARDHVALVRRHLERRVISVFTHVL